MFDIITGVLWITLVFLIILFNYRKRYRNLPPGPKSIFLFGHPVFFKKDVHKGLAEFGKKYGNIFSLYFGSRLVIVLNDYESMREALLKQGDAFSGRPVTYVYDWLYKNGGVSVANGESWRDHRRFTLHTLRDFGFGKASLEDRIMVEVQNTIEVLTSYNGQPFKLHNLLDKAVTNVICSLSFNERFNYDDPFLDELLSFVEILFINFSSTNPVHLFPLFRFFYKPFKELLKTVPKTRAYLNKLIDEHMETFQIDSPRDFIDVYLIKMKEEKENNVTDTNFNRHSLLITMDNLLNAGTETTSTTLLWAILYMVHNPDKQKKMQEEIDNMVGHSRFVSIRDRLNLPYTEATINEIHRKSSLLPLSLFHETLNDTNLFGYFIPKGALIIPNTWNAHNDSKYWADPEEFKPERFLNEEGKLKQNVESLVPFSLGKRACLGESLARMELSLFIANLFHKFNFCAVNKESPPDLNQYTEGISLRPHPFTVCAKLR